MGRFKGQKPAVPSESVCVPVPTGGAFPAGCRDATLHCGVWGHHGTVRQLDKIITEHAQRVETTDQSERPKEPPCQSFSLAK